MKTNLFYSLCLFSLLWSSNLSAQDFGKLDASPMDIAWFPAKHMDANKKMRVIYNRPQLKSRSLSTLAPNGAVWRTGANEATKITFTEPVEIGGKKVDTGSYALYTIPGEKKWEIILNKGIEKIGLSRGTLASSHSVWYTTDAIKNGNRLWHCTGNFSKAGIRSLVGTSIFAGK